MNENISASERSQDLTLSLTDSRILAEYSPRNSSDQRGDSGPRNIKYGGMRMKE